MITVPTTLVLGAGASKSYGFPSGHELRQLLCDPAILNGMSPFGFDRRDLDIFCATFLKSGMPSIDAFLARRGEHKIGTLTDATYADIGKAAIAYCLIQCEKPDTLHATTEDHWYQYLWSFMADSLDSFGENKLRIITFNYDRSLEYYLMTAMQNSFGISAQEAALQLQKIPILHVYGQLAALPEFAQQGQESRNYLTEISHPLHIRVAARGIHVIDESRDDDEVFDKAYSYLSEAQRICFLGFGFDETNVRRLRVNELMQNIQMLSGGKPKIFATTFGFEEAERQNILNLLRTRASEHSLNTVDRTQEIISNYRTLKIEKYLRASGVFN